MIRCKNCKSFERAIWHSCMTKKEEEQQFGGFCVLLKEALGLTNVDLRFQKTLYVMESFGCVLGKERLE
ncbi:MAG: hypothetical protein ACTSXL_02050 [Alphaproteobacteria bacterium]